MCTPSVKTVTAAVREGVYSRGGNVGGLQGENEIFVVSPDGMIQVAPTLSGLRGTIIVENSTESVETKLVFQSTDDGMTWSAPVGLESAFVGGNRKVTTPWYTTSADFTRGIRVGVLVRQATSVTTVQMAKVTVVLDLQIKQ